MGTFGAGRGIGRVFLAYACFLLTLSGQSIEPGYPNYTAEGIANSAAGVTDLFSANSFVSIYGRDLSYTTQSLTAQDIRAGTLPDVLLGSGVRVFVNSLTASIYYVSPGQVNLLLPANMLPGTARIRIVNDGRAGPQFNISIREAAPALFQWPGSSVVIATHGLGPVVTPENPAQPGEFIVLYGSGFGPTSPPQIAGLIPTSAAGLREGSLFQVWLNGVPVDPANIFYAGITPTFAGLYQINLRLPQGTPSNPEIRIGFAAREGVEAMISPAGRILPVALH